MTRAFLILHGIENHRPPEHWQYWLAEQLRERGHAVEYPGLPEPDAPVYADWSAELRALLEGAGDAPPASECVPESGASFRLEHFDAAVVRASVARELTIACSDADPYNPHGAQRLYGDPLGIRARVLPGAGHITPADGFGPWPWALDWCLLP